MTESTLIANDAKRIVQHHLDQLGDLTEKTIPEAEKQQKFALIAEELKRQMQF